jgi:hypothetical protein
MVTTTEKKKIVKKKLVVDKNIRDYSNEPVFIKKQEEAWEFIQKHGLPDDIAKK